MDNVLAITIGIVVAALYVAAILFAAVHIYRRVDLSQAEKAVWIVAVLLAPVISGIVWFVAGPHPFRFRLTRDLR